jgi:hypothetical protein
VREDDWSIPLEKEMEQFARRGAKVERRTRAGGLKKAMRVAAGTEE